MVKLQFTHGVKNYGLRMFLAVARIVNSGSKTTVKQALRGIYHKLLELCSLRWPVLPSTRDLRHSI